MELTREYVDHCKEKAGREYDAIAQRYHNGKKIGEPSPLQEEFAAAHNNWLRALNQWNVYNKEQGITEDESHDI